MAEEDAAGSGWILGPMCHTEPNWTVLEGFGRGLFLLITVVNFIYLVSMIAQCTPSQTSQTGTLMSTIDQSCIYRI